VKSFSISKTAANSGDTTEGSPSRLLGILRGDEENTVIGRHREQQHEDMLANGARSAAENAYRRFKQICCACRERGRRARVARFLGYHRRIRRCGQGKRAVQAGVGLGAGQSHLEVWARIYAAAEMSTPFLTFDSEGAGGHSPGQWSRKIRTSPQPSS
jgi:hypothetical protein